MNLPPTFVNTLYNTFGEAGAAFLRTLPQRLESYAQQWELTLLPAFSNLSYNYALLRNPPGWPLTQSDPAHVLRRRLDQVAERLGLDRERMRLWSVAQCVLSAWWDYNAGAAAVQRRIMRALRLVGLQ